MSSSLTTQRERTLRATDYGQLSRAAGVAPSASLRGRSSAKALGVVGPHEAVGRSARPSQPLMRPGCACRRSRSGNGRMNADGHGAMRQRWNVARHDIGGALRGGLERHSPSSGPRVPGPAPQTAWAGVNNARHPRPPPWVGACADCARAKISARAGKRCPRVWTSGRASRSSHVRAQRRWTVLWLPDGRGRPRPQGCVCGGRRQTIAPSLAVARNKQGYHHVPSARARPPERLRFLVRIGLRGEDFLSANPTRTSVRHALGVQRPPRCRDPQWRIESAASSTTHLCDVHHKFQPAPYRQRTRGAAARSGVSDARR